MSTRLISLLFASVLASAAAAATADDNQGRTYQVTITNLTAGESFTPLLLTSHSYAPALLFAAGDAASTALAALAEGGDTAALQTLLDADPRVQATGTSSGLLDPGHTVSLTIRALPGRSRLSLAAMLIPTNDAFVALQNVALPRGHAVRTFYAPAYDAGSEPNDELCVSIPGPVCQGTGGSPGTGGEGFVHIHSGIHGIGDLVPAERDWRNPVAKVVIQRAE